MKKIRSFSFPANIYCRLRAPRPRWGSRGNENCHEPAQTLKEPVLHRTFSVRALDTTKSHWHPQQLDLHKLLQLYCEVQSANDLHEVILLVYLSKPPKEDCVWRLITCIAQQDSQAPPLSQGTAQRSCTRSSSFWQGGPTGICSPTHLHHPGTDGEPATAACLCHAALGGGSCSDFEIPGDAYLKFSNQYSSQPPRTAFPNLKCDPLPHFFIIYSSLKLSHKDFCIFLTKYTRKEMNCQSIEVIYSVKHRELLADQRTRRNKHKNNHAFCSVQMPRPEITVLINWFQTDFSEKYNILIERSIQLLQPYGSCHRGMRIH